MIDHPLPAHLRKCANHVALRVGWPCEFVHPCRDKPFRKAVSTVMDDLVTDSVNIDNYNQKLKLVNLVYGCLLGELSDGVIQVK